MAARKDFQRAERSVDANERHPDDDRVERALHAAPVLMRRQPVVHLFLRQTRRVEVEHGPGADVRSLEPKLAQQADDALVERETVQRNQVLGVLAAVRERRKVGVEQRKHAALELVLRHLVRAHEAEPSHL